MSTSTIPLIEATKQVYKATKVADWICGKDAKYEELVNYHIYHLFDSATHDKLSIYGVNQYHQKEKLNLRNSKLKFKDQKWYIERELTSFTELHCNPDEILHLIDEMNRASLTKDHNLKEWSTQFKNKIEPRLLKDKRFLNATKIISSFDNKKTIWEKDAKDANLRQLIEIANELCAAEAILDTMKDDETLEYEPTLKRTKKTIDFLIRSKSSQLKWIDVKTIAPKFRDDSENWNRITEKFKDSLENSTLVLDHNFCGAGIGGIMWNCRLSFIQRTKEFEEKAALLTDDEKGELLLLFCSEGTWNISDLEDFSDFYITGMFRNDDPGQKAIAKYMKDKNITFNQKINGFCFLERPQDTISYTTFKMNVRGPQHGKV